MSNGPRGTLAQVARVSGQKASVHRGFKRELFDRATHQPSAVLAIAKLPAQPLARRCES